MTLTPKDIYIVKYGDNYGIEVSTACKINGKYVMPVNIEVGDELVKCSKVADELDRIMSATAEIDWSKEQYSYMNACIRELRDTLRGSSQEGKR